MDRIKERHKYYILGIPVMEKFVYECENNEPSPKEAGQKGNSEVNSKTNGKLPVVEIEDERWLPWFQNSIALDFNKPEVHFPVVVITAILVIALAYLSFQYIAVQNCPEKPTFDITQASLKECETKFTKMERGLESAREQINRLSTDKSEIAGEKNELIKKVTGLEENVKSLNESFESAMQREEDLNKENKILRQEKETLVKDLDDTKYKFGKCKNKNMDHEVRSMELLQEVEGLKKELKACK